MSSVSTIVLRMTTDSACCVITCVFLLTSCSKEPITPRQPHVNSTEPPVPILSPISSTRPATIAFFPIFPTLPAVSNAIWTLGNALASNIPTRRGGEVSFDKAGCAFVPDVEWNTVTSSPFASGQSVCLPVLEGIGTNSGCLIKVFCTENESVPKEAVAIYKQRFDSDPSTIKDSFGYGYFKTVGDIDVEHAWYEYTTSFHKKLRADVYFVQNKRKKCIAIQHITFNNKNSGEVKEMIRDTLTLK